MQCANPKCSRVVQDLQQGTLVLLELDVPPDERIVRSDSGFPVCTVPSKYFWLCSECSRLWVMKRWTPTGLVLEPSQPAQELQAVLEKIRYEPASEVLSPGPQSSYGRVA